jgi:tripeptidyl-peptidase-1
VSFSCKCKSITSRYIEPWIQRADQKKLHSSDPDSKSYGKFYSAEDVHDLFAPAQERVDAVKTWLAKAGIKAGRVSQSVNKQWIQLDLSASEAEQLLQTKYHFYDHAATGKTTIGCDE